MDKDGVRDLIKEERNNLSDDDVKKLSSEIVTHILNSKVYSDANIIGCYAPLGKEVDSMPLIQDALKQQKKVAIPKMFGNEFEHVEISSTEDLAPSGPHGLMEPKGGTIIPREQIDIVFVPGLAFDKRGYRIGYGHGGYDKYLKNRDVCTAALAYAFQVLPILPVAEHDVPLQFIVTEHGWKNTMLSREGETE